VTRFEIHIDELLLRGVPPEFSAGLSEQIRQRIGELIPSGEDAATAPTRAESTGLGDRDALAALVARQVWNAGIEGGALG
jgi:hypothetical protein